MKNNDSAACGTQLNSRFDRLLFMVLSVCTNTIDIIKHLSVIKVNSINFFLSSVKGGIS